MSMVVASDAPTGTANGHQPPSTTATIHSATSNPELELPKLQGLPAEQQDLFLLTFVSSLSKHVLALSPDDCTAQQFYLKKEIFQILNLSKPGPSRIVRNALGRCLAHIFGRGDRKLLFETVNELVGILSNGRNKTEADMRAKHAAVVCLGDVFGSAGDSAIGLHQMAALALLKLLKGSSSHAGLRAAAFGALGKLTRMIGASMDEGLARDVWKQGRSLATSDKGAGVVVAACRCLRMLVRHTPHFRNTHDFDSLKSAAFKTMDAMAVHVRHAAADCLAEALVQGYSEEAGGSDVLGPPVSMVKRSKSWSRKRTSTLAVGLQEDNEPVVVPLTPESPAPWKRAQNLVLSLGDILKTLTGQYTRSSSTNRMRAALAVCYSNVLHKLGEKTVEANYLRIVENLTLDLLGSWNIANNRYRLLMSRRIVDTIVQDVIGQQILGESGQMVAAKTLVNDILKNYPQTLKERPEPSKQTLVAAMGALSCLIRALGSGANSFADGCRDGLLQVLQHPSYTVQVYASSCMKTLVWACPQQLLPCLSVCMNSLSRELGLLGSGRNSPRRCIGFSHGLAASLSVSPLRPLYGSVDINSRVLTMATNLLKSSGSSELRVASTQIQVAWTLIGGLMSLGPNFVKIHLSQLLLLWKNALPKVLAKDSTAQKKYLNAYFLTHVRECALGSILAFLQFNSRLLTVDVSKRIASMLQSTLIFLRTLPNKKTTDDTGDILTPALHLQDLERMVQRRVLQCYTKLVNVSPAGSIEALLQSNLLTLAISLFADPDNYHPHSLSASIANAAGTFDSIWEVGDNSGFGVTGLVRGFEIRRLPGQQESSAELTSSAEGGGGRRSSVEELIDRILLSPVCGALEHDASLLYMDVGEEEEEDGSAYRNAQPDPPATEVVNMAIQLFAFVFPLTPAKVQESVLEQITSFVAAASIQRDPGRKAAVGVNVAMALLATLRVALKETKSPPGDISNLAVEKLLQELLRDVVRDPDQYVRSIGYEATARLCSTCGNAFTNHEIKYLVDTIVVNREPSARAGCAMALGCIQTKIGSMAASYHLKTILNILMSLCNDPHPTVHFWALEAMGRVTDAAGLAFSQFVSGTLGMLAKLYMSDTHNSEVASAITMNMEMEMPSPAAVARCIDSLINVLGPDLQDSTKSRELILTLVAYFQQEEDLALQRASLSCLEHLGLYAPGHMMFVDYVRLLQSYLGSPHPELRDVAIDGLHNLMKRNPHDVLAAAEPGLEDQLWLVLDAEPGHDGMRKTIHNWLRYTCLTETGPWLQRLQHVLKMTRPKAAVNALDGGGHNMLRRGPHVDLQDEEAAGFAGGAARRDKDGPTGSDVEPLRWQVATFAMDCLNDVFVMVAKDVATHGESRAKAALQARVADVVRMAFSASTSGVLEQRIWGLKIIGAVLKMFGRTPDPDFEEAMLLEQYQAQISSALTPAFAADSSPELASEAVNVCAGFVATGIVTDVDRMGRILKTLVSALDNFATEKENAGIGDLQGLSANAQVMVKMSVFAAWAELQVASSEQKYLVDVLRPHIRKLTPLWLESLREFARLRFEPDISMTLGPPPLSGSLDTVYAALNRETLLRFYQDAWLKLVYAIASLIEQDSEFVFDALDGKETEQHANGDAASADTKKKPGADINYRDEPVAFFFVLFGIAFEALAARPATSTSHGDSSHALSTREQTLEILHALRKILHPSVSGHAIYREAVFSEAMDLLDRMVLTEGLHVQNVIVEIARGLCVAHPAARKREEPDTGELSDDIEQLFELTRIVVLVLAGLLPDLSNTEGGTSGSPRHDITEDAVLLVRTALDALVDAAEVFPAIIKTDLHACIIHIFAAILATPACQDVIVPQALPTWKRFLTSAVAEGGDAQTTGVQLHGCLRRFLSIYLQAQKRELPTSLACVKNCLMAGTVLVMGGRLSGGDALVGRYLDEVVDCLTDRMTARIAANCLRSLLIRPPNHSHPHDSSIPRRLLPRLLSFITNTRLEDPEQARGHVAHTLCHYVCTLQPHQIPIGMALVIPALLARAAGEGSQDVHRETSGRLLELVGMDASAFRAVVDGMSEAQRGFVDEIVRGGAGADKRRDAAEQSGGPSIALKMDFGA